MAGRSRGSEGQVQRRAAGGGRVGSLAGARVQQASLVRSEPRLESGAVPRGVLLPTGRGADLIECR